MKFATYIDAQGNQSVGYLTEGEALVPLSPVLGTNCERLNVIEEWDAITAYAATHPNSAVALDSIKLLAPMPVPRRNIMCIGKNYLEHVEEFEKSGYDVTQNSHAAGKPVFFTKAPSTAIGPDDDIPTHVELTKEVDYEAELAVIIGVGGRSIPRDRALDHVWGFTALNDVTARDLQKDHQQWFLGKSLDGFCPMGPLAVTADEVNLCDTAIISRVNGEVRQASNTRYLIHDVAALIAALSAGITLQPGDIIATGTPSGVGIGFNPPRFLQEGDIVEVEIEGIGVLRNRFGGVM
jgi:2-keto-4-pentenoate hydratase/2-oxohepta-3-ene-1,7-dioic acid hydratase in catechol pathway